MIKVIDLIIFVLQFYAALVILEFIENIWEIFK